MHSQPLAPSRLSEATIKKTVKYEVKTNDYRASIAGDPDPTAIPHTSNTSYSASDRDATRLYLREIEFSALLTPEEEIHYGRLARAGDEFGRNKMITCNLRLVVKISRRYMGRGLQLPDLIEEGNLGLIHAVEKFDPERGFRFSTYATWWIRQNIERALMNQTRTIRLPIHVNKELNAYMRKVREMTQVLGRDPTLPEVAEALDKPLAKLQKLLNFNESVASLDTPVGKDGDSPLVDFVSMEEEKEPTAVLEEEDITQSVENWLGQLEEKQKEVIVRRFGLHGYERATLEQVGTELGLTRERVRQIQMDALKRLRRILENNGLSGECLLGGL
ncbi:MAG: RNA polymerase sigma factor RpoS [uncultured Thiotrichaceae bacterium]|uniref:RNA polymerase sigma factor RpoS n=1 Tax=uncultured Thiotrichaceae bacterium TaxID=298394 RepID=A0A6S6SY47_9GAMM|nr:MAG: RNA polymerase sigma factor RpoS [uncultured Thiotrichaceae bacterium]